jgi:hypothetical protein
MYMQLQTLHLLVWQYTSVKKMFTSVSQIRNRCHTYVTQITAASYWLLLDHDASSQNIEMILNLLSGHWNFILDFFNWRQWRWQK